MLFEYHLQEDTDVDCAWNHFHSTFMEIISDCVPLPYKSINSLWMNTELLKLIHKKHSLYHKWKKSHNIDVYKKY